MAWIGALVGVAGSLMSSDASSDAADTQAESSREASKVQKEMFDIARADNRPTQLIGDASRNQLAMLMGLDVPQARQGGGSTSMYSQQQPAGGFVQQQPSGSYGGERQSFPGGIGVPEDRGTPTSSGWSEGDYWASWPAQQGMNALAPMAQQQMPDKQIPESSNNYGPNNPLFGSMTKPFTAGDLASDPGYQFQREQGTQGIERNALGRSGLYSGATMKALSRFNQGLAATSFQDAFNRNQTQNDSQFNKYASLAGAGQVATNNLNSLGANYATNVGNNMMGAANAQAANYLNQGDIMQNGINGAWAAYNRNRQQGSGQKSFDPFGRYTSGNFGSGD